MAGTTRAEIGATRSADPHRTAADRLAGDGQRYTLGRRAVVRALVGAGHPLTITELLALDPQLAQSSTYRNLSVLERAGVVHRVVGNDEFARFELAEELAGHHHHLLCTGCGSVTDFTVSVEIEAALDEAISRVTTATGFRADHHRLDLIGRCATCTA